MNEAEKQRIISELKDFYKKLKSYNRYVCSGEQLSQVQMRYRDSLREKLVRQSGALKGKIIELTGRQYAGSRLKVKFDIWSEAFNTTAMSEDRFALACCIDATNEAIGRLQSQKIEESHKGLEDLFAAFDNPEKVARRQMKRQNTATALFDVMQFHPKVVEASKDCFIAGNYREAILNAFICLIDYVKERTGLDLDGDDLMNQAFSINYDKEQRKITKYPIIRINELKNKSDRDEQQGFMFLCKGAAGGIRNPKAHKLIPQSNPLHTLEYLAFASLLIRRVEEGEIEKRDNKERTLDH